MAASNAAPVLIFRMHTETSVITLTISQMEQQFPYLQKINGWTDYVSADENNVVEFDEDPCSIHAFRWG